MAVPTLVEWPATRLTPYMTKSKSHINYCLILLAFVGLGNNYTIMIYNLYFLLAQVLPQLIEITLQRKWLKHDCLILRELIQLGNKMVSAFGHLRCCYALYEKAKVISALSVKRNNNILFIIGHVENVHHTAWSGEWYGALHDVFGCGDIICTRIVRSCHANGQYHL